MNRYNQGKIYKILNTEDSVFYIGSTCQPQLAQRMVWHRASCTSQRDNYYKLYQHMNLLGKDKFYIELLETYPCNTKDELHAREGYWIRQLKPTLNMRIAGRKKDEYYQDNRDYLLNKAKQHYVNNKASIQQHAHTRIDCICGKSYTRQNKARHCRQEHHLSSIYRNEMAGLNSIDI